MASPQLRVGNSNGPVVEIANGNPFDRLGDMRSFHSLSPLNGPVV